MECPLVDIPCFFLTVIFNLQRWYFYVEKKKNENFTSLSQYKTLCSNVVSWFDLFIKCKYEAFVCIRTQSGWSAFVELLY